MLEDINYSGLYQDDDISVSITLEDPMRYNLESSRLVFRVAIAPAENDYVLHAEGFAFYVMEDNNSIINAELIELKNSGHTESAPPYIIQGIIHTAFNPEYLFQSLRVAFYNQPHNRIEIIHLKHYHG